MDKIIEEWYRSKKKTYHRVWETKLGWAWCLFFTEEGASGSYHTGMKDTETEANNEILKLLSKGLTSRQLLVLAAHHRRLDLEKELCARTENKVIGGIFQGVKHTGKAHGSTLCPKILGTYEKEIALELYKICKEKDSFIDIGCAEGYYTTGIAKTTNINTIIGIDISELALTQARKSATINEVDVKCQFFTKIEPAAKMIKGKSLIMIDVDGSEIRVIQELMSTLNTSQKQATDLFIETDFHPDGSSNETEISRELNKYDFSVVETIEQSVHNRFSAVSNQLTTSFLDQVIYGLEGRPSNQKWLIAKPLKQQ